MDRRQLEGKAEYFEYAVGPGSLAGCKAEHHSRVLVEGEIADSGGIDCPQMHPSVAVSIARCKPPESTVQSCLRGRNERGCLNCARGHGTYRSGVASPPFAFALHSCAPASWSDE